MLRFSISVHCLIGNFTGLLIKYLFLFQFLWFTESLINSFLFFSNFICILQFSFIIITMKISDSKMNLWDFFLLFLLRFPSSWYVLLLITFNELVRFFLFITRAFHHLSNSKILYQLTFPSIFFLLMHENITLTNAIFHPISGSHFQIMLFALHVQMT